jgi:hypothetical protein
VSAVVFALGTLSVACYYVVSQAVRAAGVRAVVSGVLHVPVLFSLGIGISLSNTRGVIEALLGRRSEFVRTPKYRADIEPPRRAGSVVSGAKRGVLLPVIELGMCGYMLGCIQMALHTPGAVWGLPFLVLFAMGFAYMGLGALPKPVGEAPKSQGCSAGEMS